MPNESIIDKLTNDYDNEPFGKCSLCNHVGALSFIFVQAKGEWERHTVCPSCERAYNKELEKLRENFRRQFGEK